jgi:hypothetical protein
MDLVVVTRGLWINGVNLNPVDLTFVSPRNNLHNLVPRKTHERDFLQPINTLPNKAKVGDTYVGRHLQKISTQHPEYTLMRNNQQILRFALHLQ